MEKSLQLMNPINLLLDKINPNRKIKNKWIYILSYHRDKFNNRFITHHELYFDHKGGFQGITQSIGKPIISEDKDDFIKTLEMITKDANKYPVLTEEEFELISK